MLWLVLEHPNMTFEHFESDFKPLQLDFGLMRESASFLGKSSKLVFLRFTPNTTEPFQIIYKKNLLDFKNTKISHTLNGKITKRILTCFSSLHIFFQFLALN